MAALYLSSDYITYVAKRTVSVLGSERRKLIPLQPAKVNGVLHGTTLRQLAAITGTSWRRRPTATDESDSTIASTNKGGDKTATDPMWFDQDNQCLC